MTEYKALSLSVHVRTLLRKDIILRSNIHLYRPQQAFISISTFILYTHTHTNAYIYIYIFFYTDFSLW